MHLVSSTQSITLDPDFETWAEWFGAQPNHAPIVASYQRFRPAMHSKLPADADENGNFPCPRTWAILGAVYDMAKESDNLLEVANGIVGEGTATDFMAFVNVRSQIIDPAKVLMNPEQALPDPRTALSSPDKAHAMTTGLGEIAASWVEAGGERGKAAPLQLMRALGHCTAGSREYIATGVHTFLANGGKLAQLVAASKANKDDVHVQSVIKFLAKTFRG
jgi:hypothetical protein